MDQDVARHVVSFSQPYQRSAANIRKIEEPHAAAAKAAEEQRKDEKARKSVAYAGQDVPTFRQTTAKLQQAATGIWQQGAK